MVIRSKYRYGNFYTMLGTWGFPDNMSVRNLKKHALKQLKHISKLKSKSNNCSTFKNKDISC